MIGQIHHRSGVKFTLGLGLGVNANNLLLVDGQGTVFKNPVLWNHWNNPSAVDK